MHKAFLGTGVTTSTNRYDPAGVVQAFATLGVLYPAEYFWVSELAKRSTRRQPLVVPVATRNATIAWRRLSDSFESCGQASTPRSQVSTTRSVICACMTFRSNRCRSMRPATDRRVPA